jgi:hypothetical protein
VDDSFVFTNESIESVRMEAGSSRFGGGRITPFFFDS